MSGYTGLLTQRQVPAKIMPIASETARGIPQVYPRESPPHRSYSAVLAGCPDLEHPPAFHIKAVQPFILRSTASFWCWVKDRQNILF